MVECEYKLGAGVEAVELVLIDTWWNVNVSSLKKPLGNGSVLIDTWWNVNVFPANLSDTMHIVLIDTWWNVNTCTRDLLVVRLVF